MRNLRLDICYDGTRYKGWQRLANSENTIQQKLEQTLSRILGEQIQISGSGRTDAGTHALGQVANCHCNSVMPCEEILEQLRRYLPEDIGIYSVKNAAYRFHARLNAKTKTYCYRLWNSDLPCVFDRKYVYIDSGFVVIELMQQAAKDFLGEHDFASFCAAGSQVESTVREIYDLKVQKEGELLTISVTGNGFLYNMVRIIAGTLLKVGGGQILPEDIPEIIRGKDRSLAGPTAPAKGLTLVKICYPNHEK